MEATAPSVTIYSGATFCRMDSAQGAHVEIRSGSVNLRGGRILDGTLTTGYGGNVRVYSSATYTGWSSTFNMYSGIVAGGRAKYGGNIGLFRESSSHGSKDRAFNMYGGLVHFGFAGYAAGSDGIGGNIYASGTVAKINQTGGTITYGKSYSGGGNIYAKAGATIKIGGVLEYGNGDYAGAGTKAGGNIYLLGTAATDTAAAVVTKLTVTGVIRNNLTAAQNGGNIFCSLSDITVDGGEITGGIANSRGGNIYITNVQGNLTVKNGGKILNGSAPNGGNVGTNIAAKITVSGGEITGGTATSYGPDIRSHAQATMTLTDAKIGNIYANNSVMTLAGSTTIDRLDMTTSRVTLNAGWSGAANVYWSTSPLEGNKVAKITCTTFTGKLMYEGKTPVMAYENAAYLAEASAGEQLYLTTAEAVAAANGNTVKLYTDAELTLEQDTYLDINGHTVTATGTGKVYGIDSSNDDYEGNGTLTYAGEIAAATADPMTGKQYVAIVNEGTATFHRLGAQMTAVTLRPDAAGVYFKAKYQCDEVLAALVKNYGVVLSVNNMPGADFATEEGDINIATVGKEAFVSGLETTSTSVFGILKENRKADLNDRYGKMPIYTNTYVELADGTIVMGENGAAMSLYDVLQAIDQNWADYENDQAAVLEFYSNWVNHGISSWEFTNIQ